MMTIYEKLVRLKENRLLAGSRFATLAGIVLGRHGLQLHPGTRGARGGEAARTRLCTGHLRRFRAETVHDHVIRTCRNVDKAAGGRQEIFR